MTLSLDTLPDEAPVTEPPKRWRNWWVLYGITYVRCNTCGTFHGKGREPSTFEYDGCCRTYPSKDLAVSDATEEFDASCDPGTVEWVGAFPEGERP